MSAGLRSLLTRGLHDFRDPTGADFATRVEPLREWVDGAAQEGLFQFCRHHRGAPDIRTDVVDFGGNSFAGLNLASQDYLGLARDRRVTEAAAAACMTHGTHSSGSEPMGGGLREGRELETELAAFLEHDDVVLFPTGWGAGYGGIKALVRPHDFIVMDALAHDCLQHGAKASTPNVLHFIHNDLESLDKRLQRASRLRSADSAILVITESLFSMDSDLPDLAQVLALCRTYGAALMVDIAHDLGVMGPHGKGLLAEAGVLADVDFLVGSFSKSFACIGGFFASHSRAAGYCVRAFSGSYTFSNYLMPAQVASVRTALAIVRSSEGDTLRHRTLAKARLFREALRSHGMTCGGIISPIILPLIGPEPVARLAHRECLRSGLIVNNIEYPACRRGEARFRVQVSPRHEDADLGWAASIIATAVSRAQDMAAELGIPAPQAPPSVSA